MKTVATFPRTIFFVSVGSVVLSFVFLSLVRLPHKRGQDDEIPSAEATLGREATLVDMDAEDQEAERGGKPSRHDNLVVDA